jgi:hypothetical protein
MRGAEPPAWQHRHHLHSPAGSHFPAGSRQVLRRTRSPVSPGRLNGSEPDRRTAFFPFFPALIRLVSYLTAGHYVIAGFIVTVLSGAASALGVWGLAGRVRGRRVADYAVVLYCFFPGAMTFGLLLERRWLIAGLVSVPPRRRSGRR